MGYANVNIYKNGELVKNVLTDPSGNFKVKLDTGTYRCEIVFAGHKKVTRTMKVTDDEEATFELEADADSKYKGEKLEMDKSKSRSKRASRSRMAKEATRSGHASYGPKVLPMPMWGRSEEGKGGEDSTKYGTLTAGEINDLAEWEMWTGESRKELERIGKEWGISPRQRYTVQVKAPNGMPLANAKAILWQDDEPIFQGRTDNTGRVELWGSLSREGARISDPAISVSYRGERKYIADPTRFEAGINRVTFDQPCSRSKKVDIAIVMDATGSMGDEIDYLRSDFARMIYRSKSISSRLNFRFGNVFYRDHGDDYLVRSQGFTNVLSRSIGFIDRQRGGGGGDGPEAVEIALDSAIHHLDWRENTRSKILFLVLDAPPHHRPAIEKKMQKLVREAARKGIRIVPVTASGMPKPTEYLMRSLALTSNGTYTFLTDHSPVGGDHVKPSTEKDYDVEVLNDLLVRIIKSYSYMPDCQQQMPKMGVHLPDSQVVAGSDKDTAQKPKPDSASTDDDPLGEAGDVEWSYYPNPTKGKLHIRTEQAIRKLYISDLTGKVLRVLENLEPGEPVTADLSEFSSGIYLIRYRAKNGRWISGKVTLSR